jgi:hypothetical protein
MNGANRLGSCSIRDCNACDEENGQCCEWSQRMAWIRRRNTVLHHLGRTRRPGFRRTDTTCRCGYRSVPRCLGFDRKKKCEQAKDQGKRNANTPELQGSGGQRQHSHSLPRAPVAFSPRGSPGDEETHEYFKSMRWRACFQIGFFLRATARLQQLRYSPQRRWRESNRSQEPVHRGESNVRCWLRSVAARCRLCARD